MSGSDDKATAMQKAIRTAMTGLALTMVGMLLCGGAAIALQVAGLREAGLVAAGVAMLVVGTGVFIQISGVRAYRAVHKGDGG
jgi:hypothetical protein